MLVTDRQGPKAVEVHVEGQGRQAGPGPCRHVPRHEEGRRVRRQRSSAMQGTFFRRLFTFMVLSTIIFLSSCLCSCLELINTNYLNIFERLAWPGAIRLGGRFVTYGQAQ
jgi:hypothetical protein